MANRKQGSQDGMSDSYGDDQGTRVGRPNQSGRSGSSSGRSAEDHTPGSSVSSGLEGSVMEGASNQREGQSTGAGGEAAEGIHGSSGGRGTGRSQSSDRSGSEPMSGRTREHQSGYGGQGGTPKTSSDQREPAEPTGESRNAGDRQLGDEEAGDGMA